MVRKDKTVTPEGNSQARLGPAAGGLSLAVAVGALLMLQTAALLLKAWDEKQTDDRATLDRLQGEALAASERLAGQAETMARAMDLGRTAGASNRLIAQGLPNADTVIGVRSATSNPVGSQLRHAGDLARELLDRDQLFGVTADGDLVVVSTVGPRSPSMAVSPLSATIADPGPMRLFSVVSNGNRVHLGDPALTARADTASLVRPGFQFRSGRAAAACVPLADAALSVCATAKAPFLAPNDYIRLVIYALLFAAPALAILGLARRVRETGAGRLETKSQGVAGTNDRDHILANASAGAWQWDADEDTIALDTMAARLLDIDGEDVTITREDLLSRLHDRDLEILKQAFSKAQRSGEIKAIIAVPSASGAAYAEFRGGPVPNPGHPDARVFGGLVIDATAAKTADIRLRRAEQRLRNAIEGFSGPFALWDQKRRLVYWNHSFEIDFGLQDLRPGLSQEAIWMARAPAIRRERIVQDDKATTLLELHERRWLKVVERQIPDQGFLTLGIDVTENVRNEDLLTQQKKALKAVVTELEQSEGKNAELARKYQDEKLKAEHAANTKSAFLANMSHELRTPLNAINGFSEFLVEELFGPLGDKRYHEYSVDILSAGRHLLDLINDILDMSKIEAGKMTVDLKPIDPVDPVDAAVRMIRRKADDKGITLAFDAADDLPAIDADHRAMRQMVLNLVSNAIKFTPENGRIKVSVQKRGEEIRIAVTDSGIGIAKKDLDRLGQPFEQVNQGRDSPHKGTGLGLALTKSFAEMHGGRLTMASEVGKGTRVTIYLPVPKEGRVEAA